MRVVISDFQSFAKNYLIRQRFLPLLFISMLFFTILITLSICIIDPYGVSPIKINLPRLNTFKSQRVDIDRFIKPYEVWYYQPKTIFMGTSRFQQSLDPAVLKDTSFAPAYNASIPASTLEENAAYLEKYFLFDKNLKSVFIELFIYNFFHDQYVDLVKPMTELLQNTLPLFLSNDAIQAAYRTMLNNSASLYSLPHIEKGGNWVPSKNRDTYEAFNSASFIKSIINTHKNWTLMTIRPSAIQSLERIITLCRKHHASLYLIISPSYPWDDYRLLSLGYWPMLEEWLRKMSSYKNVISFSQYNSLLEELPRTKMTYWNDPIHFSAAMGTLILKSIANIHDPLIPNNFYQKVTEKNVESLLKARRQGLNHWIAKNNRFAADFDHAKIALNSGTAVDI
jgi:hypothetical protein